mgnify:CR=1 FL=1
MDKETLNNNRHSLAHLLAAAVIQLYPDTKRTIGPAVDNGFYFDFAFSEPISEKELPKIEKKMREISKTWSSFERHELTAEEAKKEYPGNEFKIELIEEFTRNGEKVSFYKSGDYWDLCKGGHSENFKDIQPSSWKLDKIASAYWRGDSSKPMLTRIYGLAFETKEALDGYLTMLDEAKKRDHKKLGISLDLFTFSDLVGPGLPLWTPKGTMMRTLLDDYVWQLRKAKGYQKVEIPHITKKELYETSGHWDKFKDELFRITTREGHEFAMKPMNCPHHTQIYARAPHSYRELPIRFANTTVCYRDEQTGELSGLSRVRAFAQDDAHVFCRTGQVKQEMEKVWDIISTFYTSFGFELETRLSFHDPEHKEKYLGSPETWAFAEKQLKELVDEKKVEATITPGEAAFYGPKIDFLASDSIGRKWQVATIQLDMNMPERFDLTCINEEGANERIVMIHAAIMGSIERFMSIIIEHFAGNFPTWLAPVQVALLPISDKHIDYTEKVAHDLRIMLPDLRFTIDDRSESIGKKIREASVQKIPYQIIMGDKEKENSQIAVRTQAGTDLGSMSLQDFLAKITTEIETKSL